jgi:putative membrane protein
VTSPATELARDVEWQRLDPRMLLVHPIRELLRFLPVVLGIVVAGSAADGDEPWSLIGVAFPVALGLLRYLTTRFRITGGRVELQRGLLSRHVLSTPLDRVRTVDLTSSPIHRLLGLSTVRVGTGTASKDADDRLDLDGLPTDRARELRRELLLRVGPDAETEEVAADERVVVRFSPRWLAYAPFTMSGLVITAGLFGAAAQLMNTLRLWDRLDHVPMLGPDRSWWLLGPLLLAGTVLLISLFAVVGYAVNNWAFTVSHTRLDGSWHVRRGLLTTRETSLDDDRVHGVTVGAQLGLRLAGGRRLSAIVTGLDRRQQGAAALVPPAPRGVVLGVAADVLGTPDPLKVPLASHGPRARRRRFVRALVPALTVAALAVVLVVAGESPWLLTVAVVAPVVGLGLAVDRWRALGHAVAGGWFVVRSGSLGQRRSMLRSEGIIGWNLRSTWFQRRAGLTKLVATTAGGRQAYAALDVPEEDAVAAADRAVPGLVEQFLR